MAVVKLFEPMRIPWQIYAYATKILTVLGATITLGWLLFLAGGDTAAQVA